MPHFVRGVRLNFSPRRLHAMWCRHCQQDVPAARDNSGPAACSRCQQEFVALPGGSRPVLKLAAVADCGVALEDFDLAAQQATSLVRPKLAGGDEDLRRLERLLRPQLRSDFGHGSPLLREPAALMDVSEGEARFELLRRVESLPDRDLRSTGEGRRPRSGWGVKLLLIMGTLTFASGAGLLVAANLLLFELAWRWGFALTIAGEGLLIGGLAGLAVRLWRNSRRVNSQLESIDRRLGDVQASVGGVSGAAILPVNSLWRIDASVPSGRVDLGSASVGTLGIVAGSADGPSLSRRFQNSFSPRLISVRGSGFLFGHALTKQEIESCFASSCGAG